MTQLPKGLLEMRRVVVPVEEENSEEQDALIRRINETARIERQALKKTVARRRNAWLLAAAALLCVTASASCVTIGEQAEQPVANTAPPEEAQGKQPGNPSDEQFTAVQLQSGAKLSTSPGAKLRIQEPSDAGGGDTLLALDSGSVSLDVPTLGPRSLTVRTPHADVMVHGTQFSVAVLDGALPRTRVNVTEGLVSVNDGDREVFLRAGESWLSSSSNDPNSALHPNSAIEPTSSQLGPTPSQRAQNPTSAAKGPTGTLANENRLYQAAMQAKRAEMYQLALIKLDELLASYPDSPLANFAKGERKKLRKTIASRKASERPQ